MKRWDKSLLWIDKIEKLWKLEKGCEESSCEKEWKNESEGEDGEKVEGIKRGVLPYVATSSFPPPVIMTLQTMAWFFIFH
jgi:hypothetical protein